ncbi:tocopherol cyclase family protein [Pannus brasiliensis CCIBt3594]|uniref:Tocopherol cyclase family protein n=1 Tax=Pannus brasiliensis CCIBt3594 TaxID=1427578 RepID=A0AAW9QN57_9CHRO
MTDRFFEGWYFRVALPELGDGFAFMYSIQDPKGDRVNSGGAVQILAPGDRYLCRTFPDTRKFWATRYELGLGHWRRTGVKGRPRYLDPEEFENSIEEGYQATLTYHRGRVHDPVTGNICQWSYSVEPIYTWGSPRRPPKATAGLLSYLPIADPGWQILLASAVATGYIDWMGDRYEFHRVPFYSEKNWGYSFPDRWFWINGNAFPDHPDLTITAVGSTRKLFGFTEEVGIIGIHYLDRFYEFVPWNSRVCWRVDTWGSWEMSAENEGYRVYLVGKTEHPPASVRVPTENGLTFRCLDTLRGDLYLKLEDYCGGLVLEGRTSLAGLEIGGIWPDRWRNDG